MRRASRIARIAGGAAIACCACAAAAAPAAGRESNWLAGDLHVHTTYSHDSYGGPDDDNTEAGEFHTYGFSVREQFELAASRELDFLAITDHDDIRSQADPGFGTSGVIPLPGYESSLEGHAQMLGATRLYETGEETAAEVRAVARRLRRAPDRGVFQVNHPALGSTSFPADADWSYLYAVVPDAVEVWNISRLYQPPLPSASSSDDAVRYWEGWLDRGERVAATGGSDSHWRSTSAAQGVGQPTTWVYARGPTPRGVLRGLRHGRTFISHQPPGLGGPKLLLKGDRDGDGRYGARIGSTVAPETPLRAVATGAPGARLRVVVDGGEQAFAPVPVGGGRFRHDFRAPPGVTWVRAELVAPDTPDAGEACGDGTTYCRGQHPVLAMTSALYLERGR